MPDIKQHGVVQDLGFKRAGNGKGWKDFDTVRANFIFAMDRLLAGGAYVGIATHDRHLVCAGMAAVDRLGLSPDRYEFQMLLGVEDELRRILLGAGHRVRVYVPFGEQWHAYSVRRLRENPQIAGYAFKAIFKRG